MARITVEDCVKKVDRFSLIVAASQRVREIEGGAPLTIARENDKFPVVALREIAEGTVDPQRLEDSFVKTLKKQRLREDWEETLLDEDPLTSEDSLGEDFKTESEDEGLFEEGETDDSYVVDEGDVI